MNRFDLSTFWERKLCLQAEVFVMENPLVTELFVSYKNRVQIESLSIDFIVSVSVRKESRKTACGETLAVTKEKDQYLMMIVT